MCKRYFALKVQPYLGAVYMEQKKAIKWENVIISRCKFFFSLAERLPRDLERTAYK